MDNKKLEESFETWWNEEAKFQIPPTSNYRAIKDLLKIAWLNGAYTIKTNNS